MHEKKIVNDYSELKNIIPSDKNHYVIIMTFGYRTDDIPLRALLSKQFKYIGVLGSKKKMEKMFLDYRKERFKEKMLRPIHSPIGIFIKSETPEEIAISIAAEIIQVKAFNKLLRKKSENIKSFFSNSLISIPVVTEQQYMQITFASIAYSEML